MYDKLNHVNFMSRENEDGDDESRKGTIPKKPLNSAKEFRKFEKLISRNSLAFDQFVSTYMLLLTCVE